MTANIVSSTLPSVFWSLLHFQAKNPATAIIKISNKNKINLSFERLFGKLINNQENMARIISSQQGRIIQKAAKGIVSSIFLPIGF